MNSPFYLPFPYYCQSLCRPFIGCLTNLAWWNKTINVFNNLVDNCIIIFLSISGTKSGRNLYIKNYVNYLTKVDFSRKHFGLSKTIVEKSLNVVPKVQKWLLDGPIVGLSMTKAAHINNLWVWPCWYIFRNAISAFGLRVVF